MASPKGFILYRIYYGECMAYLGRTKQPLQARIRGHMFASPMHRAIDIHNVTRIEYTELSTDLYGWHQLRNEKIKQSNKMYESGKGGTE